MKPINVLVFGSDGIVGQMMSVAMPEKVNAWFSNRTKFDLNSSKDELFSYLRSFGPLDAIVNLSGQNNVDVVEQSPEAFHYVNVDVPGMLAQWCSQHGMFFVQGSSQAVFSGNDGPYSAKSVPDPITQYGFHKKFAEELVLAQNHCMVARLTFVYGVRPFLRGRVNPLEDMFKKNYQVQVNDRWFSPLYAKDAAEILWDIVVTSVTANFDWGKVVHLGEPIRVSRYDLACHSAWDTFRNVDVVPVSHDAFSGIAERPRDTTWAEGSLYKTKLSEAIVEAFVDWKTFDGMEG